MKYILIAFLLTSTWSVSAQQIWKGLNIGSDLNYHYLFGGAQVDGRETIGDGHRWSAGIKVGYAWQLKHDIIFGTEFQFNQPFGNFLNEENPDGTLVEYTIKPQTALQFNLGKVLGANQRHAIQAYFAFNQTRFDIQITRPTGVWTQTDFENFGRVGVAYEFLPNQHFSTRMQIGTSMDGLDGTDNGVDTKLNFVYHF